MDSSSLHELSKMADFLVPCIPFVLGFANEAKDKVIDKLLEKLSEKGIDEALKKIVSQKPSALPIAEGLVLNPNDKDDMSELIKTILSDPENILLVQEISKIWKELEDEKKKGQLTFNNEGKNVIGGQGTGFSVHQEIHLS